MTKVDKDISYHQALLNLRWQGDQAYHSLTATHITANSLIIAALGIAAFSGDTLFGAFDSISRPWEFGVRFVVVLALCCGGMKLTGLMKQAQDRYIWKNRYIDKCIEHCELWSLQHGPYVGFYLRIVENKKARDLFINGDFKCDSCIRDEFVKQMESTDYAAILQHEIIRTSMIARTPSNGPMSQFPCYFLIGYAVFGVSAMVAFISALTTKLI